MRTVLKCCRLAAGLVALLLPGVARGQEHPAKRLSSIVGVAVDEYGKAVDAAGKLVNEVEMEEAVSFLGDAKTVAERLSGDRAALARAVLDTLAAAVSARKPPADVVALHKRFGDALGAEGALDLPRGALDIAAGRALFEQHCAACHGTLGRGDGPSAKGLDPAPPAIGTAEVMHEVSPALAYRITSVGIKGTAMASYAGVLTSEQRWNIIAYLGTLRAGAGQVLQGEGLFLQRCASCHGTVGAGDGALAAALTKLPPEVGSFAWQAERSDAQIGTAIREGIPGSAMPPARDLSDPELASLVAFVRTLPMREGVATIAAGEGAEGTSRRVLALLDQALEAARAGRRDDAADRAFDSYIAFEPLETPARAKDPGRVAAMERHFVDFKGALKAGDLRAAERARNTIQAGMPGIIELTKPPASGWGAFFQSFLIILREGFEAILVVGAVVTFLIKTGHRRRLGSIWWGVGLGLAASAVTAVILATVLDALPATREVIEGGTMLVAVAVLFSVSYWLISKVEAAKWQKFIRDKVTTALSANGGRALALVAFLAVYREGAEVALFYQALFRDGQNVAGPISLGIVAGFAALAVIFTLFYRFGVRIPMRPFFATTSALLYWMAFVFMGKGIRELQEGNAAPITVIPGFPSVDALGIYPTVETLLGQLLLAVLLVFALVKTFWPRAAEPAPAAPPVAPPVVLPPGAAPHAGLAPRPADLDTKLASLRATAERLEARVAALEEAVTEKTR